MSSQRLCGCVYLRTFIPNKPLVGFEFSRDLGLVPVMATEEKIVSSVTRTYACA